MADTKLISPGIPNYTLKRNLRLNNNYLSNDGGDEGVSIDNAGDVGINIPTTITPSTKFEVFIGKYLGLVISLTLAMFLGYGGAELIVYSTNPEFILSFIFALIYSLLLAGAGVGLGFVISVSVKTRAAAIGTALFLWFVLVVIYDSGFLGVITVALNADALLVPLTLVNPVETTRILALMHMADSPLRGELGPQASYLLQEYGSIVASRMLTAVLLAWVILPAAIAYYIFKRQDAS